MMRAQPPAAPGGVCTQMRGAPTRASEARGPRRRPFARAPRCWSTREERGSNEGRCGGGGGGIDARTNAPTTYRTVHPRAAPLLAAVPEGGGVA